MPVGRRGDPIVPQPSTVELTCATVGTNECCARCCNNKVRPHPRMAFGFLRLPHKILPVQTINIGDDIVKFARWDITKAAASVSRAHAVCFLVDVDCQLLARELSPEKTDGILAAIASKADEAAVPSPLSCIRLPRAWLSLMPCACMYRCSETLWRLFLRAACTFRNREVSVIARHQAHAGRFDRPAGGGSFSCRGHARDGKEKRGGRG